MARKIERERRYLLLDYDKSVLSDITPKEIEQAYLQDPPNELRVRIIDNILAVATAKDGVGMDRPEEEVEIPLQAARFFYNNALYKIQKARHLLDGNEIDIFHGVLNGITLLECESPDVTVDFEKPSYVKEWIDVTDSLSNNHLAHLAYEIERGFMDVGDVFQHVLPNSAKCGVLTGGPCSAKSTAMEEIRNRYSDRVRCVPEVATAVMGLLGLRPPPTERKTETVVFQRNLARVQETFEALSIADAIQHGQRVVIFDRGIADNAAYLSFGGIETLAEILHVKPKQIFKRYDRVCHLNVPKRSIYEAHRESNPHRRETHEQAKALDQRIGDAWGDHPHYERIKTDDLETKISGVLKMVSDLLAS